MIEKNIQILTENIFYKHIKGNIKGKKVLILHGWGGKSDSWLKVGEILSSKGFEIFIPDLPGHGKSSLNKVFNIKLYGDIVCEFIKKQNLEDFYLIGHSNGGKISLELLFQNKIFPNKIILIGSSGLKNPLNYKQKLGKFLAKNFGKIYIPYFIKKLFYRFIGGQDYLKAKQIPFLKETFLNCLNFDLEKKLPQILQKINLIWGNKDNYTPIFLGKKMNKLLKNSNLKILNGERHGIHLQNPGKLSDEILKIIK